jgi:hypothetical protein
MFDFQRKFNSTSIYKHENGSKVFKYSIKFESLLSILIRINYQEFQAIANNYNLITQRYCELGCELSDETNREKAFSAGKNDLNLCVKECLKILAG